MAPRAGHFVAAHGHEVEQKGDHAQYADVDQIAHGHADRVRKGSDT